MKYKCTICSRVYIYDYKSKRGHTKKLCNSCCVNRRRFEVKRRALEYLGGKCKTCGYNKCSRALSFHHRDPKTKLFEISGGHARKWESVEQELDKCDLLCQNCHCELHDAE